MHSFLLRLFVAVHRFVAVLQFPVKIAKKLLCSHYAFEASPAFAEIEKAFSGPPVTFQYHLMPAGLVGLWPIAAIIAASVRLIRAVLSNLFETPAFFRRPLRTIPASRMLRYLCGRLDFTFHRGDWSTILPLRISSLCSGHRHPQA